MFIRLRLRGKVGQAPSFSGYPVRISSLLVSVIFHSLAVVALALISVPAAEPSRRPIYDELIRPYEHKIIIYKLPKILPDVTSGSATTLETAKGEKVAKRVLIARSVTPTSKIQLIQTPAPEVKLTEDIPLPDVIAKLNTGGPAIPDQLPAKKFTPPPRSTPPKLPMKVAVIDDAPPAAKQRAAEVPGAGVGALSVPMSIPSPVASKGNATADVAVASLHPSTGDPKIPTGDRAGRFSEAPLKGRPSEGPVKGALTVPNLSVHEEKSPKEAPPPLPTKVNTILYAEKVQGIPPSTLSAPLRPASRSIPRSVEGRFTGRSVYTMVIPIENLPAYSGDWIVWFAELDSKPGETPLMRAPIPFRKLEPVESAAGARSGVRAQIAATLDTTGKLRDVAVLNQSNAAIAKMIVADLSAWEFKPATRSGVAVNVQVVLEITFNLPSSLAARTTP